jgi:uncharacterized hydrophobic protein (TIGR00271 family)
MIHVSVVSPAEITAQLVPALASHPGIYNLTVLPASVRKPEGDAIQFDVVQGEANDVIARLRQAGLDRRGSISVEHASTFISTIPDEPMGRRSRLNDLAPVWEEVEARIRGGARFPPSWYFLLVIAGLIAAVGLLTNSQILIVGAMVVGPEYAAIVAGAFGLTVRDFTLASRCVKALAVGFGLAVLASLLFGLVIRAAGLAPPAFLHGVRPVSNLINTPDWFSAIVALLAGLVGVIALTEARANTLIGVFISVTTIPAAADIGVSAAFGSGQEAWGSIAQLLLNITILGAVAAVGIPLQRAVWRRITSTATGQRSV